MFIANQPTRNRESMNSSPSLFPLLPFAVTPVKDFYEMQPVGREEIRN